MTRHVWTSDQVQFLIDTHSTFSITEQADRLGMSYQMVRWKRSWLVDRGVLQVERRKNNPLYPPDTKDLIVGWLQEGWSIRVIAKRLKRTVGGIKWFCRKHGIQPYEVRHREIARVYTAKELSRIFGVNDRVITRWIAAKKLKARRDGSRGTKPHKSVPFWRITDESVLAFLADRSMWPTWNVEGITDPDLRTYAAELRLQAGGHWMSSQQIARRYHYSQSAAQAWYRQGFFSDMRVIVCYCKWYVWSADLAGFVPPLERQTRKSA